MKTWIRRGLVAAGGLLALGALAVGTGLVLAEQRLNRQLAIAVEPVAIPADGAARERGAYLYASRGCADCHGPDGTGRVFVDGGGLYLRGPNLTLGPGSAVAGYRPEDWVRTLRHGVKPDGRPVRIMPSEDYSRLTDADLGALVAHLRSLPPRDGVGAAVRLPPPVRVLYGFGLIDDAAAKIDHRLPPAQPVPEGVTPEHGAYVATMCVGCHGAKLAGGRIPGGPPDWPAAADLRPVPGSGMAAYDSAERFVAMLRSGRRPDGSTIAVMPFEALSRLNDVDARALYLYLKTLPPAAGG